MSGITITPIRSSSELNPVCSEWEALRRADPHASPFQSSLWVLPWWEHFGSGELLTLAAWNRGKLAGLAPLFIVKWEGRRQVTFLGNGVSDQLGFIADSELTLSRLLAGVSAERERWDVCDFQDLAENAPLFRTAIPHGFRAERKEMYTCSSIPLPGSVEEYMHSLPHGLRRNLRRYREHLGHEGAVEYTTSAPDKIDEYLDALFALHGSRWAERNEPGMLDGDSTQRFHRTAARNLQAAGLARLHAVRLDGRIIAIAYVFRDKGKTYGYQSGFDPEFSRFSPGALVLEYAIHQAIAANSREFDFLRGDEAYKADWGAKWRTSYRLRLTPE